MNQTIFNAIKTKLNNLITTGTLKKVYDYERSDNEGFPCVHLTGGLDFVSEILDNARDKRTYDFNLRIIQERLPQEKGGSEADRILRAVVADILTAFDADNDLGVSGVLRTTPSVGVSGYLKENTERVIDIKLSVEVVVNITF